MASVSSPSITPALPGAWASNWTLSRPYFATSDNTPKLPSQDLDRTRNEKAHPALLEKHDLSEAVLAMGVEPYNIDRDVDDDPNDEEDFYSFISHSSQEDTDTPLFSSSLLITRADPSDGSGLRALRAADSRPFPGGKCSFDIKDPQLGSEPSRTLHEASASASTLTQELGKGDGRLGLDKRVDGSAITRTASCVDAGVPAGSDLKRDMSRKRVCRSGTSMDQHLSATSDDDIDVEGRNEAVRKEEYSDMDGCSERSSYTTDDIQPPEFANRLSHTRQSSRDSVNSLSHSSWHHEQRRHGVDNRPGALHSTSILHLAQPSGDSPWTLALDPTRPSHELNILSRQSSRTTTSVSLSDESSIAFNSSQMHNILSNDHIPSPSYRQSPATRIRARYHNGEGYEIRTIPRYQQESEYSSSYSSPQAYSFPTMNSASSSSPPTPASPFVVYAHNDPPRAKPTGVIQKTKALCSKFKKFVTRSKNSAPPPQVAVEYKPYLRRNAIDLAECDVSPPLPYLSGRTSVSLNGYQGCQRTTKVSTVSVPLTQHMGHRRTDAVDVHHVYQPSMHDREEVKGTKASRRFSLPAFAGSTSISSRSNRFSTFPSNRRLRLSMVSATHIN